MPQNFCVVKALQNEIYPVIPKLLENEEITGFKSSGLKDDLSVVCLLLHVFNELD